MFRMALVAFSSNRDEHRNKEEATVLANCYFHILFWDVTLHLEYSALEKDLPSSTFVLITISEHTLKPFWIGIHT
jgi:hypothetical protein